MSRTGLTDARVRALRPANSTRNVRDTALAGFGVRVLPSGLKRFFLHVRHEGRRIWKIVGDPDGMTVGEERERARGMLASIRTGRPASDEETLFEAVTERSMPGLSAIMKVAEADGLRPEGSNPCKGIRRYRKMNRDRFLSDAEFGRPGRALQEARPFPVASIIRLLALTGCRSSEIRTLRWGTSATGTSSCATARRVPAPCGCRRPPARSLTGVHARRPGSFLPAGPTVRSQRRRSATPGHGSGRRPA